MLLQRSKSIGMSTKVFGIDEREPFAQVWPLQQVMPILTAIGNSIWNLALSRIENSISEFGFSTEF
jgi:hypothetical protein